MNSQDMFRSVSHLDLDRTICPKSKQVSRLARSSMESIYLLEYDLVRKLE